MAATPTGTEAATGDDRLSAESDIEPWHEVAEMGKRRTHPTVARCSNAASVHVQTAAVVAGKPTGVCGYANFVSGHGGGGVCMPESAVTSLSLIIPSVVYPSLCTRPANRTQELASHCR